MKDQLKGRFAYSSPDDIKLDPKLTKEQQAQSDYLDQVIKQSKLKKQKSKTQ